jgi:hypothetical protein
MKLSAFTTTIEVIPESKPSLSTFAAEWYQKSDRLFPPEAQAFRASIWKSMLFLPSASSFKQALECLVHKNDADLFLLLDTMVLWWRTYVG